MTAGALTLDGAHRAGGTRSRRGAAGPALPGVLVVLSVALSSCAGSSAANSCVSPTLSVKPSSVRPGTQVQVHGRYFLADCADTNHATSAPLESVTLTLAGQGLPDPVLLGRARPSGGLGSFDLTFTAPSGISGQFSVRAKDAAPAPLTIAGG